MKQLPKKLRQYIKLFGLDGIGMAFKEAFNSEIQKVTVSRRGISQPITVRLNTSDCETCKQVFRHKEYDIDFNKVPKTIIDAGANIGLASIYFANRYPNAKIIALEPESSNFEILKENTQRYPNVTAIQGALWHKAGQISLVDPGEGHFGFQTHEVSDAPQLEMVDCYSVADLMAKFNITELDILKIDIEGAEKEVFETNTAWLANVAVMIVELHDRFKAGCSISFNNAVGDFPLRVEKGENVYVSLDGWLKV